MIKVTLAKKSDAGEICHFIRLSYVPYHNWPDKVLFPWVEWYCAMSFCVIGREVIESGPISISGHIKALLMGRPCLLPVKASTETFHFDPNGQYFFVDLISTKYNSVTPVLTEVMVSSIGMKDYLAFTRDHGNMERVHICKTKKILKYYAPRKRSELELPTRTA